MNVPRRALLHKFNFKQPVSALKFSPDGLYFAVSFGHLLQLWHVPRADTKQFAPFALYKTFGGHVEDITCIDWSHDSAYVATGWREADQ